MQIVDRTDRLRAALFEARRRGTAVALVPTMGALHEGHLRLVDEARRLAPVVVMSLFVNPLQFGPHEDFARYPRDPDGDAVKARERGVDLLFAPAVDELYPPDRAVVVAPLALADRLEGAARPGHFTGVLTIVAKLLNIVQPQFAMFGQKDVQQVVLIRAMVRDLDFPVHVVTVPTVREPDGLALSSRNRHLALDDRRRAAVLSRALDAARRAFEGGVEDAAMLEARAREVLATEPEVRVEYLAIVDPLRLEPATFAESGSLVAIAARVGGTRLIDNIILGVP